MNVRDLHQWMQKSKLRTFKETKMETSIQVGGKTHKMSWHTGPFTALYITKKDVPEVENYEKVQLELFNGLKSYNDLKVCDLAIYERNGGCNDGVQKGSLCSILIYGEQCDLCEFGIEDFPEEFKNYEWVFLTWRGKGETRCRILQGKYSGGQQHVIKCRHGIIGPVDSSGNVINDNKDAMFVYMV